MSFAVLPIAIICLALIYAAISDASVMRISNRSSALVLVSSLLALACSGLGLGELSLYFASGGIMFLFGFILFAVGGFGAGDAKLMAAVALLFQPAELANYVLAVTVLGGLIAIVMMAFRAYVPPRVATSALVASLFNHPNKMPYGIAISLAALLMLPTSELVLLLTR